MERRGRIFEGWVGGKVLMNPNLEEMKIVELEKAWSSLEVLGINELVSNLTTKVFVYVCFKISYSSQIRPYR